VARRFVLRAAPSLEEQRRAADISQRSFSVRHCD
jgi:hypothetical protein